MVLEFPWKNFENFLWNSSSIKNFLNFEFHQKFSSKFEGYFFKELEFLELELQGKLEFHKLKF